MLSEITHGNKPLAGRRIAVLALDGFELVELAVPAMAMRLAGARVDVISIHPGHIRGMNLHEPAKRVSVDLTLEQANPTDYDGLRFPAGSLTQICCGSPPPLAHSSAPTPRPANRSPASATARGGWPRPGSCMAGV